MVAKSVSTFIGDEVFFTVGVQHSLLYELSDARTLFIEGVKLHQRVRPQVSPLEFLIDKLLHLSVANFEEALNVLAVFSDNFVAEAEDIECAGVEDGVRRWGWNLGSTSQASIDCLN